MNKIRVLDGLRGYAALMVILSHMPQITSSEVCGTFYFLISYFNLGYLGVDLFFVLSGFLITRILVAEKKKKQFSFKVFYLKRAIRIFPIYYLTLILSGLLFTWKGFDYLAVYVGNYYFVFEQGLHPLAHTWSLSVEEHYYLFWPIILCTFKLKHLKQYVLPIVLIITLSAILITYTLFDEAIASRLIYKGTQFRILSLSMGSLLVFHEKYLLSLNRKKATMLLFFLGAIGFVMVALVQEKMDAMIIPVPIIRLFMFSICSVLFFVFVLLQEKRGNSIDDLFNNRLIGYIGKISYGLYLYHYPIFFGFGITRNQLNDRALPLTEFIVPLSLVFIVAMASYTFIEKPLMHYKAKWVLRMKAEARRI
ncbi:MAG: acyltransferase [Bacteroidota bacterium]